MDDFDSILARAEGLARSSRDFRLEVEQWARDKPQTAACAIHPSRVLPLDMDETSRRSYAARQAEEPFELAYAECPDCKADALAERGRSWLAEAGVPKILTEASIVNFRGPPSDIAAALKFGDAGRGFLIIGGDVGTGKSHLATAILRLAGRGRFITHNNLLLGLRKTYGDNRAEDVIEATKHTRMLVIDDFGLRAGGRDELPMLQAILDHRHGEKLPTVITTNLTLEELLAMVGTRMADRIRQSLFRHIILTGPSQRPRERGSYMR
jgi:DNA replication protein DnaC